MSDNICSICLDNFKNPLTQPCGHTFCTDCFDELIKHRSSNAAIKCPLCRQNILSTEKRFILLSNAELLRRKELRRQIKALLIGLFISFIYILFKIYFVPWFYGIKNTCHK